MTLFAIFKVRYIFLYISIQTTSRIGEPRIEFGPARILARIVLDMLLAYMLFGILFETKPEAIANGLGFALDDSERRRCIKKPRFHNRLRHRIS
jgi:hypothetical protein